VRFFELNHQEFEMARVPKLSARDEAKTQADDALRQLTSALTRAKDSRILKMIRITSITRAGAAIYSSLTSGRLRILPNHTMALSALLTRLGTIANFTSVSQATAN
jgi:hypothetical protein